ncbi:hypothetical protein [Massilia horti]|uniref:Lipoprotein n=1 Tax=Massilia horti TaxID=2562153 RepID=A0A4Y9SLU7_9BURK|nr:hypothetical protein [Massilia horti]TFW27518.1 hypothetical protein E4O92_23725 [Massilia horti]
MLTRRTFPLPALIPIAALACALVACNGQKPSEPPKPKTVAAEPVRTKEKAIAELMALPEVKAWSTQIEQTSHGKAHGAVIEDDTEPRMINGKPYWQFSFVENRSDRIHRRESFLVAQSGNEILIEDLHSDTTLTLPEWRREVHRVNVKSAQ